MTFEVLSPGEVRHRYKMSLNKAYTFRALMELTCASRAELEDFLGDAPGGRRGKIDTEKATAMYEQGMNDSQIAASLNVTRMAVHEWRNARGLHINRYDKDAERMEAYNRGLSDGQAAKELGIGKTTFREWRRKKGLKPNGGQNNE